MNKSKEILIEQNTPEWLKWRQEKIGASDCPIIMDLSPWMTPYNLWQHKMGMLEIKENEKMRRGKDLEPKVRLMLEEIEGVSLRPCVFQHQMIDYMVASIDAISDNALAFEIKCPGKSTHQLAIDGIIENHYIAQMQHQMEVLGIDKIIYVSYNPDFEEYLIQLEVHRDQDYINEIIDKEAHFFSCMKNFVRPDLKELLVI